MYQTFFRLSNYSSSNKIHTERKLFQFALKYYTMKILFAEGDLNLIRGKYRGKEKEKKENKSSITSPTRNAERGPADRAGKGRISCRIHRNSRGNVLDSSVGDLISPLFVKRPCQECRKTASTSKRR